MNLMTDPWIPVRCASGQARLIAPLQLADDDPPLELNAIRPDFNGALAQWLTGVMQWLAPEDPDEWRGIAQGKAMPEFGRWREIAHCFEFDGGDRRFMQDMDFDGADPDGDGGDLAALLLEAPGGNTIRNNADLFVKRRENMRLSLPLAAQALLTLQTNAPSGGQGHRTSLRGGGPVSMLLWPDEVQGQALPLWRKLWLNTLPLEGDEPRTEIIFPWMAPCLTSEGGRDVHAALANQAPSALELLLLCYFATPRRIRLRFEDKGTCSLSGVQGSCAIGYETRNLGANYRSELFRHPLSPYYQDKKTGHFLPVHVGQAGFTYADWLWQADDKGGPQVLDLQRLGVELRAQLPPDCIWAFGFAMDNMKCLAWHERRFSPLRIDDPEQTSALLAEARVWLKATEETRQALGKQLRVAWSEQGKGDTSVAERELYARTEQDFRALVLERAVLETPDEAVLMQAQQDMRRRWQQTLACAALTLFKRHAERGDVAESGMQAIQRAALAHKELSAFVYGKLAKTLEIRKPRASEPKGGAGKGRKAA